MRVLFLITCLLAAPQASAWEFRAEPICTIEGVEGDLSVQVTFDPGTGIYTLDLTRPEGWPGAPVLSIRFDQGMGDLTITTDRHSIDGTRLTVTDRGFGNVLRGLEFFGRATVMIGDLALPIDTTRAADAVRPFRACPATPNV